ncbi:MAG: hypothetical protein ACE5KH_05555 [Candidatus Geothermarchaeales archaeon]
MGVFQRVSGDESRWPVAGRECCHCGKGTDLQMERVRLGRIVCLRCEVLGRNEKPPLTEFTE